MEKPEHVFNPLHLSDEEYARTIQTFVVVCTDVAIIDITSKTIWLARRASRPARDWWWFIGGRSLIGETEYQSAQRCFQRETGFRIDVDRFSFVCMHRYFFSDRQQEPQSVGCDTLGYCMTLQLTPEKRGQIVLDANEYLDGGLRAFHLDELQTARVRVPMRDFCAKVFA